MQWHTFILHPDNDMGEISVKNLIDDLSERFRESNLPREFQVWLEGASGGERYYYFTPKVAELAGEILKKYGVDYLVPPPKSMENMRQIVL
jgi:hypothetical protein